MTGCEIIVLVEVIWIRKYLCLVSGKDPWPTALHNANGSYKVRLHAGPNLNPEEAPCTEPVVSGSIFIAL